MTPPFGPQKPVAVQSVNLFPGHRKGHQPRPVDTATPLPSAQQRIKSLQRPVVAIGYTSTGNLLPHHAVGSRMIRKVALSLVFHLLVYT